MATYSKAALEKYFGTVDAICLAAVNELAESLVNWLMNHVPRPSEFAEFAKSEFLRVWAKYGIVADEAACEFFELAVLDAINEAAAERGQKVNKEQVDRLIGRLGAKHLGGDKPDYEGFAKQLTGRVGDYVGNDANNAIARNVEKHAGKGLRFARILQGERNCTFCVTLASRGFVYKSMNSAEAPTARHHYCDCKIIPGFAGTKVQGVNLDKLGNDYIFFTHVDSLRDGSLTEKDRSSVKEEFFSGDQPTRERLYRQFIGGELPAE